MITPKYMHMLRVELLAMSRLSQRALDDSIKGYELQNLDFSRHALSERPGVLEKHQRRMKELCRELMNGGIAKASDSRFIFAALNLGTALPAMYEAAGGIAFETTRLLGSGSMQPCQALVDRAQLVNRSMRLCAVALFEEDACHAETALQYLESSDLREVSTVDAGDDFERAVSRSLGEIAKQIHEMADSIVFWLKGNSRIAASTEDRHNAVALFSARQQENPALPYMQSKTSGSKGTRALCC